MQSVNLSHAPSDKLQQAIAALNENIIGKPTQVKLAIACILAKGHLLVEDLPGTGKTTLSHHLASVMGLDFHRVQFTSDLLPADILGVNVYNSATQTFDFHAGPIFSQVVLADEINRSGPKTQSALLEAMEEQHVTIDGVTRALPDPFFVIATQNPHQQSGTYVLPESQLDRFLMRIHLGFPDFESEKQLLMNAEQFNQRKPCSAQLDTDTLFELQAHVKQVIVSETVINYILRLVSATREESAHCAPLSPRASLSMLSAAKAWAFIHQRDYVTQEDIQQVFPYVAEHRLDSQSSLNGAHHHSQRILANVNPV